MQRLSKFMIPAFTLNEMLLSMWVVVFCAGFYATLLSSMNMKHFIDQSISDTSSIYQMRLIFALSKGFLVEKDALSLIYLGNEAEFVIVDDRIILQDGYQVFFSKIEEAYFQEEEYCVYLHYKRNQKEHKAILGCY